MSTETNMAGPFYLMRAFRSPKPTETDPRAWSLAGVLDGAAAAVAYFFTDNRYWPWDSQKDCGVRVYTYVFAPLGTELRPDPNGGAPRLHSPDGKEPLTGETVLKMSDSDLKDRGIVRRSSL